MAGSAASGSENVIPKPYIAGLVKSSVAVAPEGIKVVELYRPASVELSPVPYTAQ